MNHVFISYAREDSTFVRRLHAALTASKHRVWVDWEDIPPTAEWMAEIRGAIESADAFLFVVSPKSLRSEVCAKELELAGELNKRLVPVLHREPAADDIVPDRVSSHNWLFFRESDDFGTAFAQLTTALGQDLDWIRAHTALLVRAREWVSKGSPSALLLRGGQLSEAEQLMATGTDRNPTPTSEQAKYVFASRQAAIRRQRGALMTAVSVVIVVAMLAGFAWIQRGNAIRARDEARARQLIANAGDLLNTDPELAMVLATEAHDIRPSVSTEAVVRRTLAESRVRSTLRRHQGPVFDVAFSADGDSVATAGADGAVRVSSLRDHRELRALTGHEGGVSSVAFNSDGRLVASGGDDGSVRVWDGGTGREIAISRHHGARITGARFSSDGRLVVSSSEDDSVRVWDWMANTSQVLATGHTGVVLAVAFSPSGDRIASAGGDGTVTVVSLRRTASPLVLRGHTGAVFDVVFGPDATTIATAGTDGTVRVWDWATQTQLALLPGIAGYATSTAFSVDGRLLVAAGTDGQPRVWDWRAGDRPLAVLRGHKGVVNGVAFSGDSRLVATAGADGTVRIWDWEGGAESVVLPGHAGPVNRTLFSPDDAHVLSGGHDGAVRVWPASGDGPPVATYEVPDSRILALSPSADGRLIAIGFVRGVTSGRLEGGLAVWDWQQQREAVLTPTAGLPTDVMFAPGKAILAVTMSSGFVSILDVNAAKEVRVFQASTDTLTTVSFSPSGDVLIVGGADNLVHVFRWETATQMAVMRGHEAAVNDANFSPDGRLVVSAGQDRTVRVWDAVHDYRQLVRLDGHEDRVEHATFLPDGNQVVSASIDGTYRMWEWRRPPVVVSMRLHEGGVIDASPRHDGRRVVSGGDDGLVRISRCEACDPFTDVLALADRRARERQLSSDELRTYVPWREAPEG